MDTQSIEIKPVKESEVPAGSLRKKLWLFLILIAVFLCAFIVVILMGKAIQPNNAQAYYNRGNDYFAKGDLDNAISEFNKAIQLKPDFAEAYNNRGVV